ncbi:hypothetical protein SCUCBS95973_001797 [Sporothrix curviconia]|uniref:non-specific serine/threonine protein kinase n=1 Tax=Sporothrix curviconia TaxID=1260050 RepID=A0ABP0B1L8_9PEZI
MATAHIPGPVRPPHPLALFRLKPVNNAAWAVVRNPNNRQYVSGDGGKSQYLDIGGIPSAVNDGVTVATLGRVGDINKVQRLATTGLAGVALLAKTIDDTETAPETTRVTRMHTPALGHEMLIRYVAGDKLGEGAFGVVHRVINVDTGSIMARKLLKREYVSDTNWQAYQREVKLMAEIKHPHVIDLIWSQHWDRPEAEIFTGVKDGTLRDLVLGGSYAESVTLQNLAQDMLYHMLQALDALVCNGIIHRDIKPENILYVHRAGSYQFQLGDFGLSNYARTATSYGVGTEIYMAPEMNSGNRPRTSKVDVWSLFVTILWTLNVCGFRTRHLALYREVYNAVRECTRVEVIDSIRPMAAVDPDQRASAAQMLWSRLWRPPQRRPWRPSEPDKFNSKYMGHQYHLCSPIMSRLCVAIKPSPYPLNQKQGRGLNFKLQLQCPCHDVASSPLAEPLDEPVMPWRPPSLQ